MTASILAGGLSRRMGTNKALIEINGETIIGRAVNLLKMEFNEVNIIANDPLAYESLSVRVYADIIKGAGSLGGIYTALFHARSDYVFVVACDMPFLSVPVIKKMIKALDNSDAIVPFIGGRRHPLHAVYSKRCMKTIAAMIEDGNLRINSLLEKIRTKDLSEEVFKGLPVSLSVENVNTKEELTKITENEKT
ncbi:MAG: molybdenum cofactor guanylyltransferase [Deltaproteobacteria bacterium]|nr:molybdenum cofactor guanylyltransferase [Deltaproteobacteria bacterium]